MNACSPYARRLLGRAIHAALLTGIAAPALAHELVADGIDIRAPAGAYDDAGLGAGLAVFRVLRGGSIVADGPVNITVTGASKDAVRAETTGSSIVLDGGWIKHSGDYGSALLARGGGQIEVSHLAIDKWGAGDAVEVDGVGSHLSLSDSEIRTYGAFSDGLLMLDESSATLTNSRITTKGNRSLGINLNSGTPGLDLHGVEVITEGNDAVAMWLADAGRVDAQDLQLRTLGRASHGLDMRGGQVNLQRTIIETQGRAAYGAFVRGDDPAGAHLTGSTVDILTHGENAVGLGVQNGGDAHLADSRVNTKGARAHALFLNGAGSGMVLDSTFVLAEGADAWGLTVNGGAFHMRGGGLGSTQHGAIGVFGPATLDFEQGAQILGGNGVLLSLEASAADLVEFNLRDGVLADGDIVAADPDLTPQTSNLQMLLEGDSHWKGATQVVDNLRINTGSSWTITDDSTLGSLSLDKGVVMFDAPDSNGYNTLTIQGDYHSDGGTLVFNTRLDGDGAPSDRMLVEGDTSGYTWVRVNALGGSSVTSTDGIELIEVRGQSNGQFELAGRAVNGSYEYFLFQGGKDDPDNGNWYLRSENPIDPPPCDTCEPELDPAPDPVLRPEPGVYWANQAAALLMFQHSLNDRLGGRVPHPGDLQRGAWARTSQQQRHYGLQGGQLKLKSQTSLTQVGTDLFGNESTRVGVLLGQGRSSTQSLSMETGYAAQGRVDGSALGVYASWMPPSEDQSGLYLDGWLQWARYRQEVQGDALQVERYTAHGKLASLEAGYALPLSLGEMTTLYVEPQLQLTYNGYRAAEHVEHNGTAVTVRGAGGLATRVGVRLYGQRGLPGVHVQQHAWVQPYLTLNWLRNQHATDSLSFDNEVWRGEAGSERVEIKAGAQWQMTPRLNGWGEFGVQSGQGRFHAVGGQLGLRYSW